MPPRAHDQEVRILAAIAGAAFEPAARARLLAATTEKELAALLGAKQTRGSMRPSRTSLADI
jgi:mannitol/fructose-specific phosphotransferase system IIA component (Ntr-type)